MGAPARLSAGRGLFARLSTMGPSARGTALECTTMVPTSNVPEADSGEANGVACIEPDSCFLFALEGVDGEDIPDPSDSEYADGRPFGLCDSDIVLIGPAAPNLVRTVGY